MDKKFIEQAKTLRIEYFKAIREVSNFQKVVQGYKDDLDNIGKNINENEDKDEVLATITEFEKKINQIETSFNPQIKRISDLENQADRLFENIKECYPNMTLDEIKQEMIPYLQEINLEL